MREGQVVVPISETKMNDVANTRQIRLARRTSSYWRVTFDVQGAMNGLQFTGDDFFVDKDVCSIVLEVPNSVLGPKRLGLWARTLDGAGGKWVQADRGGLPAQAVLLVGAERDAYLAGAASSKLLHHGRRPRRRWWPQSALTRVISVEREHSRQSCGVESKVHETPRRIRCAFQPK